MIRYDGETLEKLHEILLELLAEADRICRTCGIRYTIVAGTMLGAVRHGGLIPWDDDADIGLLREDYEAFRAAAETVLDRERFEFQDHTVTAGYRWGYGKLRFRDSLFLREFQDEMPYSQGVFIDVFPLDAVPDGAVSRTLADVRCFFLRKSLWARIGRHASRSRIGRAVYRFPDRIPEERLLAKYDRIIERSRGIRSRYVRILLFPTPNRTRGYLRRWYEETEDVAFDRLVLRGMKEADRYLTFKFGDYRAIPGPGRRKIHPVSQLRLPERLHEEKEQSLRA